MYTYVCINIYAMSMLLGLSAAYHTISHDMRPHRLYQLQVRGPALIGPWSYLTAKTYRDDVYQDNVTSIECHTLESRKDIWEVNNMSNILLDILNQIRIRPHTSCRCVYSVVDVGYFVHSQYKTSWCRIHYISRVCRFLKTFNRS